MCPELTLAASDKAGNDNYTAGAAVLTGGNNAAFEALRCLCVVPDRIE